MTISLLCICVLGLVGVATLSGCGGTLAERKAFAVGAEDHHSVACYTSSGGASGVPGMFVCRFYLCRKIDTGKWVVCPSDL